MASSPQFPPNLPRQGPHRVPRLEVLEKKGFPWPLLAIIAAVAILIAIIVWLPQVPKLSPAPTGAEVPAQPTGNQIQFSGLKLTAAPLGNAFYLDGLLLDRGSTEITGMQVQINFLGQNGQIVGSQTRPVGEMNERFDLKSEDLADRPVKPGETRPVRIYFDHAPASWNKQLPQLAVTEVTATKP
jgi:hypothetical protein